MYLQKRACWIQNIFGRTEWHIKSPVWKYVEANSILGHMALQCLTWSFLWPYLCIECCLFPPLPPSNNVIWEFVLQGATYIAALLVLLFGFHGYWISWDGKTSSHILYNRLFASNHRWIYIRTKITVTPKRNHRTKQVISVHTKKQCWVKRQLDQIQFKFILIHVFDTRRSKYIKQKTSSSQCRSI